MIHEDDAAPAVLRGYTAADHRRRLLNIAFCNQRVRTCLRRHHVGHYLPGQAYYNLCEYPCRTWTPDERDEAELDRLRDHGIGLIQLHSDWSDPARRFGGHTFAPPDPDGMRRFVDMAHRRGVKVIAYMSTGFFERRDPDFRSEWARENDTLVASWFRLARCSPASVGWRAYLLPQVARMLDDFGLDGIYNDVGYHPLYKRTWAGPPTADEVFAFEEGPGRDESFLDLLALLYDEVHRRGGIVKVHARNATFDEARSSYDYLWVGETAREGDALREASKNLPPFVVPCLDLRTATIASEDSLYLDAIPYMQFPLLLAGRPYTGERGDCAKMSYADKDDHEEHPSSRADHEKWAYYQSHPDGPWCYASWDVCPPRPERRATHARWLKAYRPLVEAGTRVWLQVGESDLFHAPLPDGVVASLFANRDLHVVLVNYNDTPAEIATRDVYVNTEAPASVSANHWTVPGRSLLILRGIPPSSGSESVPTVAVEGDARP